MYQATEAIESIVPMVVCSTMFATIFGIAYLRSRENMAMIERGLNPRENKGGPKPFAYLKYGLLLIGSGLGLLIAYLIDLELNHRAWTPGGQLYYHESNPALYFALVAVGGGTGLVVSFFIEKKFWLDKKEL